MHDRRHWKRYPLTDTASIIDTGSDTVEVSVLDESFGGVCLFVSAHGPGVLEVNQNVYVIYRAQKKEATIRYVKSPDAAGKRIGLAWRRV